MMRMAAALAPILHFAAVIVQPVLFFVHLTYGCISPYVAGVIMTYIYDANGKECSAKGKSIYAKDPYSLGKLTSAV